MNKQKASEEFVVGKHGIGWIDSDFTRRFSAMEFDEVNELPSFQTLSHSMLDSEIGREMKPGFSTLGDVLMFMNNTPNGCKDGYANIFYFPECVVGVRWHDGEWLVGAWLRDGRGWDAGNRVFSPATNASALEAVPSDAWTLPDELTINGTKYRKV